MHDFHSPLFFFPGRRLRLCFYGVDACAPIDNAERLYIQQLVASCCLKPWSLTASSLRYWYSCWVVKTLRMAVYVSDKCYFYVIYIQCSICQKQWRAQGSRRRNAFEHILGSQRLQRKGKCYFLLELVWRCQSRPPTKIFNFPPMTTGEVVIVVFIQWGLKPATPANRKLFWWYAMHTTCICVNVWQHHYYSSLLHTVHHEERSWRKSARGGHRISSCCNMSHD